MCTSRRAVAAGWLAVSALLVTAHVYAAIKHSDWSADGEQAGIRAGWLWSERVPWHVRAYCQSGLPGCNARCGTPAPPVAPTVQDELGSFLRGIGHARELDYVAVGANQLLLTTAPCVVDSTNGTGGTEGTGNVTSMMSARDASAFVRFIRWNYRVQAWVANVPVYDYVDGLMGMRIGYCTVQACFVHSAYLVTITRTSGGDVMHASITPIVSSVRLVSGQLVRVGQPTPAWTWVVETVIDDSVASRDWWKFYAELQWRSVGSSSVTVQLVTGTLALFSLICLALLSCEHARGSAICYNILAQIRTAHTRQGTPRGGRGGGLAGDGSDDSGVELLGPEHLQEVDNIAYRFKVHLNSARARPAGAHALARLLTLGTWICWSLVLTFGVYFALSPVWPGDVRLLGLVVHLAGQPLAQLALERIKRACCIATQDSTATLADVVLLGIGGLVGWPLLASSFALLSPRAVLAICGLACGLAAVMAVISWQAVRLAAYSDKRWEPIGTGEFPVEGFAGGTDLTEILVLGDPTSRRRRLCTRGVLASAALVCLLTGVQAGYIGWHLVAIQWSIASRHAVLTFITLAAAWCVSAGAGSAIAVYVRVVVDETAEWWWHVVLVNSAPFVVLYAVGCIHLLIVWPDEMISTGTRLVELLLLAVQGLVLLLAAVAVGVWSGKLFVNAVLFPSHVDAKYL